MVVVLKHNHRHDHGEAHDDHGAGKVLGCGDKRRRVSPGPSTAQASWHGRQNQMAISDCLGPCGRAWSKAGLSTGLQNPPPHSWQAEASLEHGDQLSHPCQLLGLADPTFVSSASLLLQGGLTVPHRTLIRLLLGERLWTVMGVENTRIVKVWSPS